MIVAKVVESRKSTIAARPAGYIPQALKKKLSSWVMLASEYSVVVEVFGIMLLDTAALPASKSATMCCL